MWEHTRFIALSIPTRLSAFVLAIILASAAGCKKQADANTELANAVSMATGVRFAELPMSPPRILAALDKARAAKTAKM